MKFVLVTSVAFGVLLCACSSGSSSEDSSVAPDAASAEAYPETCTADAPESDGRLSRWSGPGTRDGALVPAEGDLVLTATYLQLRGTPEASKKFQEVMAKINQQLASADGLVAYRVSTSESCGTARTLSAYKDETSMLRFVASPAHGEAMTLATTLSRGKSKTTHWTGKLSELTLETGAKQLAAKPGAGF